MSRRRWLVLKGVMEPEWVQACLAALDRFANDPELVQLATSGAGEWLSLGEAAARGKRPHAAEVCSGSFRHFRPHDLHLSLKSALGPCCILGSGLDDRPMSRPKPKELLSL